MGQKQKAQKKKEKKKKNKKVGENNGQLGFVRNHGWPRQACLDQSLKNLPVPKAKHEMLEDEVIWQSTV